MKMTSFGSLKRLFACLSVPREVVSCLLPGSLDLSFQKFALGHVLCPGRHRLPVSWTSARMRKPWPRVPCSLAMGRNGASFFGAPGALVPLPFLFFSASLTNHERNATLVSTTQSPGLPFCVRRLF